MLSTHFIIFSVAGGESNKDRHANKDAGSSVFRDEGVYVVGNDLNNTDNDIDRDLINDF